MKSNFIALEDIRIAKPCRADWNRMTGDERARFCGSCHKNVYDISQMTREQTYNLIAEKEGNLCLRLHRRSDGTVITSDCPVGIAATPRPLWWGAVAVLALMSLGLAGCATQSETMGDIAVIPPVDNPTGENQPIAPVKAATSATQLGQLQAAPTSEPAAIENHLASVTLGAPMMPQPKATPKSAPTPQPTNAPMMGEPTMGQPQISAAVEADMGIMAPICQKPQ